MKILSTSDEFYLEQHADKQTPEELAKNLRKPLASILNFLKKLRRKKEEAKAPEQPATPAPKFATQENGKSVTTAMTSGQSQQDDEDLQKPQQNEEFYNSRLKNAVHKIDPNKPIR